MQWVKRNRLLIVALVVAGLLLLIVQLPRLLDPLRVELDFRNFYLVFRLQDPDLYPGRSFGTLERASPLYTAILWGGARFISPELVHKLLPFPLLLIAVAFIYRLGEKWAGRGTALALAIGFTVFNLASNTEVAVSGGLQRSFAVPLLVALVWAVARRNLAAMVAIVLLCGLIYLPILPVAGLTGFFAVVLRHEDGGWRIVVDWRKLAPLYVVGIVVVAVLFPFLMEYDFGSLPTGGNITKEGRHMLVDPVYQRGGRYPLFVWFPFTGRAGLVSGANTFMQLALLSLISLLIVVVRSRRRRPLPVEVRYLLFGSVTAFVLSWLAILLTSSSLLYLPSRHTEIAFSIILVVFVFLNMEETLRELAALLRRHRRPLIIGAVPLLALGLGVSVITLLGGGEGDGGGWQLLRLLLLGLCLVLAPILWLFWRKEKQRTGEGVAPVDAGRLWPLVGGVMVLLAPAYILATGPPSYRPSDDEIALYNYLRTLPTDVTVAGDPCSLDDVLYYARRNPLYSCWNATSNEEGLVAGLEAYYAEHVPEIVDFCRAYDVDVLVVNERTLTREYVAQGRLIYDPHNDALLERVGERSDFALARVAEELKLFEAGSRFVVACSEEGLGG